MDFEYQDVLGQGWIIELFGGLQKYACTSQVLRSVLGLWVGLGVLIVWDFKKPVLLVCLRIPQHLKAYNIPSVISEELKATIGLCCPHTPYTNAKE